MNPDLLKDKMQPGDKEKREYFKSSFGDKRGGKNSQKNHQYMLTTTLYHMLGEYAVTRELLNCYHTGLKYFDGL